MKHRTYALTDHDVEVISCAITALPSLGLEDSCQIYISAAFPLVLSSSHISHWIHRTIALSTPLYLRLEKSAKVNSHTLILI